MSINARLSGRSSSGMDRRGIKNIRRQRQVVVRERARALMAERRGPMYPMGGFPAARGQNNLNRQLRALIASKKRDASDVTRSGTITATKLSCLTSTTDFAVATSGTGLLDCEADEVLVNSVRFKGIMQLPAVLDLDPTGNVDCVTRKLVVWFNKPLLIASAAGTLPPVTEVLVSDAISSLPVTAAANGGRFTILSDRKWNLGTNTFQANTAVGHARVSGRSQQNYDYIVKVNKMCKFKGPSASGSNAGGHYDSDVSPGQVDRGLLVCYTMTETSGGQVPTDVSYTRLNYTG